MKQRDVVTMPADQVAALLAAERKVHLATINPDGTPHLVTMFYGLRDGQIAFWTYRASQKARNLARDPRITCLVEDVASVGRLVAGGMAGPAEVLEEYVRHAAVKRVAYVVEPRRVVSWDHRRLT